MLKTLPWLPVEGMLKINITDVWIHPAGEEMFDSSRIGLLLLDVMERIGFRKETEERQKEREGETDGLSS